MAAQRRYVEIGKLEIGSLKFVSVESIIWLLHLALSKLFYVVTTAIIGSEYIVSASVSDQSKMV